MKNRLIKGDTEEYVRESMIVIDSQDVFLAMKEDSLFMRKNILFNASNLEELLKEMNEIQMDKIGNIKKENPSIILNFDVPENLPDASTEVLENIYTCFKDLINPNILWTISKSNGEHYLLEMLIEVDFKNGI